MRIVKAFLTALTGVLCLASCQKVDEEGLSGIGFDLLAREARFVWADNIRGFEVTFQDPDSTKGFNTVPLPTNSSVKLSEYILFFNTCNVDVSDIKYPDGRSYETYFMSENYHPLTSAPYMELRFMLPNALTDATDPVIEKNIKQYLKTKHAAKRASRFNMEFVDYRTTPLKNIKVTCNQDLFGVKAGESLNNFLVVSGFPLYHDFIITSGKNLVTGKTTDISLSQYISYRPMAPAAMSLMLRRGLSIPEKVTAQFTVELTLEGDSVISATTKPVTLLP